MGNQHPLNEKKGGLRSPTIRKLAKDGRTWTPTEQVVRDKCLRQFCKSGRKGVEVSSGNSEAYKRGWVLAFGTPEEKARAQAELDAERGGYAVEVRGDRLYAEDAAGNQASMPADDPTLTSGDWLYLAGDLP